MRQRGGFAGSVLPFQPRILFLRDRPPEFVFARFVNSENAARVAVPINGDEIIWRRRFWGGQEFRTFGADGLGRRPVGAVGIDDAKIALLVETITAGIPPLK